MAYREIRAFAWVALLAGAAFVVPGPAMQAQEPPLRPQGMDALAARATFSTNFTFDKTMLDAASQTMPDGLRPVIAKLRSISVHTFRFSAPGMYDTGDLDAVRAQYSGHGWTHWAKGAANDRTAAIPRGPDAGSEKAAGVGSPDPMRTDVWVRMNHADFDGVVVLAANGRNVNLVVVDGAISPLDLLHLRGHFGIPRFSADSVPDAQ
jgi:hypothetical protein